MATKAVIEAVEKKLMRMPRWRLRLAMVLTRYGPWHIALAYGQDWTYRPALDIRIWWLFIRTLWWMPSVYERYYPRRPARRR